MDFSNHNHILQICLEEDNGGTIYYYKDGKRIRREQFTLCEVESIENMLAICMYNINELKKEIANGVK